MFSMEIVDSDAFLDLPLSAQALYFHLGMRADDDGAIANAKRVYSSIGASEKDLQLLLEKRFLLKVDGIIFVKHWKINNYISKDRYNPTAYQDEYSKLRIKDNKSYTECIQNRIHGDIQEDTQESIHECVQDVSDDVDTDKNREDKKSKDKNIKRAKFVPPTADEVKKYCEEKGYTIDVERFIDFYTSKGWMVGKNKMKDWKAAVRNWMRQGRATNSNNSSSTKFNNFEEHEYDFDEIERELLEGGIQ